MEMICTTRRGILEGRPFNIFTWFIGADSIGTQTDTLALQGHDFAGIALHPISVSVKKMGEGPGEPEELAT